MGTWKICCSFRINCSSTLVAVVEADGFARFLTSMLRATAVVNTAQDGSSDGEGDLDDGLLDAMDAKPRDGETKHILAEIHDESGLGILFSRPTPPVR